MAKKFDPRNFECEQPKFEEFLSTLTINNQEVNWELIGGGADVAKAFYHETVVTIVGDVIQCTGNFKGTLKGFNAETGGCNIEVVETLAPPPRRINVGTIGVVVHDVEEVDDDETVIPGWKSIEDDISLEPETDFYVERECEHCGAPGGVLTVSRASFNDRPGIERVDFTNHNDWEHNVDLTKNNLIKTSYFCCSDCRSYEY